MEEKIDRLFVEKDCPHCGPIRAEIDMKAASSPDYRGKDGQRLYVFSSLSNDASKEMLFRFGLEGKTMPVLVTWEGEVRTEIQQILAWMRKHNMSSIK